MYKFEIGKQVVCISKTDKPWPNYYRTAAFTGCPKPGQILTIRNIHVMDEHMGLQFHELNVKVGEKDAWFNAREFRPVRDTNIDEFVKLTKELETSK